MEIVITDKEQSQMDLINSIKGMTDHQKWKPHQIKAKPLSNKFETDQDNNEEIIDHTNNFKNRIIELQENVKTTQDKINILQLASDTLNNISDGLSEIRELALETIDQLEDYDVSGQLKTKLENIDKLEALKKNLESISDPKDNKYNSIIQEFQNISELSIKLSKIQGFDKDLNENTGVETVITRINETLNSVSSAQGNLNSVKDSLITNIKSLNITLENMISSYSRIRSIESASETIQITQDLILREALKSISIQIKDADAKVTKLIG